MTRNAIPKHLLPAMIVLGVLALGGCASGNIGESWQCPLARGGTCDSVAAADPAVPDTVSGPGIAQEPVLHEPLYRVRERRPAEAAPCQADCEGSFDPFGWLARLFGAEDGEDARSADGAPQPLARTAAVTPGSLPGSPTESPTEPFDGPAEPEPADDDPGGDDLRTEEVVARIWIAPFVDGAGVYREGAHVRVVLEPAGWRLR